MKELADLLGEMLSRSLVRSYALSGATAQMRYTEPVATLEGYRPEGEAIRIGAWPVQFIPVFNPLTREAMEQAETADFEGIPIRVVRADHLAVIALSVGRAKELARILALLESGSVSPGDLERLAERHDLAEAWR